METKTFKKLTASEIIEILKKYSTVGNFCDEDFFLDIPEDFKFSDELQVKIDASEKAYKAWDEAGRNWKSDNPLYQEWQKNREPINEKFKEFAHFLGLGEIEKVASYGGEDMGSTYYSVKYFKDHDVYLRVDGWYQSHYGVDFDDWDDAVKEVKPKEKTVTVYE